MSRQQGTEHGTLGEIVITHAAMLYEHVFA